MDLSYAQVKRLYKKKKYKFSVGAYQWIQLGMCLPIWSWKGSCDIDDPECEVFECQDLFDEPNLNEISFFSYCEPRLGITFYF